MSRRTRSALLTSFVIVLVIIGIIFAYGPISDAYVLSHANPAMVALADQAGMNRQGKLVFLRTDPQLVSDKEMESACASNTAANNSNGFIEQGCYNPATNRIYIRDMPSNLHDLEVSTASYEMLHPVYNSICSNAARCAILKKAIEQNFTAEHNANLNAQIANFAKTEPGARDLELFSLLGTGFSNLTSNLAAYYTPYFTNINATVNANTRVEAMFQNDQSQITQLKASMAHYDSLASAAYASSVRWAHAGSQYYDDYYYNQYQQYINEENNVVDQYNQLIQSYNTLVTEYDGTQPVKQLQPAQTQTE